MRVQIPPRRSGERHAGGPRALSWLPRGETLPDDMWESRHSGVLTILWIHIAGIAVYGTYATYAWYGSIPSSDIAHRAIQSGLVVVFALLAGRRSLSRRIRSCLSTLGLVMVSALIVHLAGGLIEAHFHFFLGIAIVTLYQN
jgi:hypothetical protein